MQPRNVFAIFKSRFASKLDKPFLILENDLKITFRDTLEQTGKIAQLLNSLGITKGDRIVVQTEKTPAVVMLYLACLQRGIIFIPLNTAYTKSEVRYFIEDAMPKLFVCGPDKGAAAQSDFAATSQMVVLTLGKGGTGTLLQEAQSRDIFEDVCDVADDETAAILYTSGTTGRSKGAMLTHRNLASNVETLHSAWGWVEEDVLLHALPIFHAHGLFVGIHLALYNASTCLFHDKYEVGRVIESLPNATVFMGVPTFYTRLLESAAFEASTARNMRLFISGSAPLLEGTFSEFEERTGQRILERYGMTEALMITSNPYDGERIAGTVGFPLDQVEARVADSEGKEVVRGEPGVLEIRGPNVFKGYWNMPEKTAEEFKDDGYFVTGDISIMDDEGRVSIVGRSKDLIISGGFNVYPKEVELVIDSLVGVSESAVIGVPHPDFGESVIAVVVTSAELPASENDIVFALSNELAKFKRPKRVIFTDQLPRNAMGKVQKSALRKRYANTFAQ